MRSISRNIYMNIFFYQFTFFLPLAVHNFGYLRPTRPKRRRTPIFFSRSNFRAPPSAIYSTFIIEFNLESNFFIIIAFTSVVATQSLSLSFPPYSPEPPPDSRYHSFPRIGSKHEANKPNECFGRRNESRADPLQKLFSP